MILADFAAWRAPSLDHEGVEDWSDCFDPDELRIRLDVALEENAELHEEVGRLSADNARLRSLLSLGVRSGASPMPPVAEPVAPVPVSGVGGLPYADASSSAEAKIALFRALFAGREDVYARRWVSAKSGRTGWSPAEDDPFDRNKDNADRVFWPLTDETVYRHLDPSRQGRSELHIGLYPLLADDTCRLLACDFDGKDGSDWRADAIAYAAACQQAGVPALLEISRSGKGAHVWTFFTAPVAATTARALGMALLRRAIDARGQMALSSYDRLFPAQDFQPVKVRKPSQPHAITLDVPQEQAMFMISKFLECSPAAVFDHGDMEDLVLYVCPKCAKKSGYPPPVHPGVPGPVIAQP
ncbi:hypothetical protein E4N62_45265 [Streptomyces sp. MNU76]|uniref:TOTE conflict system archaeo-eukaryotic primase domain-containing protein n=1 Tax=Streptomyces sp. MNU76 TaxID=2560026 RepID=UPI001E383DBD|nr:hypothetical protein [Streptomyces sp. MNU76]MCC9711798.1 hypothetical protein [Streptomyces sp. MNU76]